MLTEKLFQHHFRLLDFRRIELAFDAQTNLALLEAIENVRFGNRVGALVADAPNLRTFLDLEDDDFTIWLRRIFDTQPHILEELRIPKRLKIPAQSIFVVGITFPAKDARLKRVAADAPITDELYIVYDELLLSGSNLRVSRRVVFQHFLAADQIHRRSEENRLGGHFIASAGAR